MPGDPLPPNIDLSELETLLGPENVRSLVQTFLREYPILLAQLATADQKTRHRVAHSLKSNARVVGARALAEHMARIEVRLDPERRDDVDPNEFAEIAAEFEGVAQPLREYVRAE